MIVKSAYYNPSEENIAKLIHYLYSLSGKKLSSSYLRKFIFKNKGHTKDPDLEIRSHIQAAAIYLNYLISNELNTNHEESIKTTIAEIIPAIREVDQKEDCSFIIMSSNTLPSNIHYNHAKWIFYKNILPPDSRRRYDLDILVLYALRLSLEKRIMGILGIQSISSHGRPVPLSKLIPIAMDLKNIKYNSKIKWNEIIVVNDFLNINMHRHIRPFPWIIHQAFEVLNPLLLSGRVKIKRMIYGSIHSSTIVDDDSKLQEEIGSLISVRINNPQIKWSFKRDVLLINRDEKLGKI